MRKYNKKDEETDPDVLEKLAEEQQKPEIKQISYFTLYRYSTPLDKIFILIAIICSLIAGVGTPVMMILFGDVTGDIILYATQLYDESLSDQAILDAKDGLKSAVLYMLIASCILGAATVSLTYISTLLFSWACTNQIAKIRENYMKSVLNQDISWYDINRVGDFSSRITDDLLKVEEGIGDKATTFAFFVSTFISGLIIAFIYGWELTLICLINFPVNAAALSFVAWLTSKFSQKETDSYASAGAVAEEVLSAIKTVFAFGGEQKEIDRYKKFLTVACKNNTKRAVLTALSNAIMYFLMFASYALSFWYGIKLIIDERELDEKEQTYTPGTMITVFFCVLMSSFTLTMSAPYFQVFGTAKGAATNIFNVIDHDPTINLSKKKGKRLNNFKGLIKFEKVDFFYPARKDVQVLHKIDLEINPGETIALVGTSGCGKSTCVQLLQRFYDPTSGRLLIDGVDVAEFDLEWFRGQIGVVGQEPILFATSIGENIRFGNMKASKEDVEKAAKRANAHKFISTLPDGYDTLVGQRGSQLSGGQKQRIAIARALVREPKILLLDEATSALDTESEAQVQRAIDAISKECTTIIVAHRLSTIRNANKIVVFSEGKIVEIGDHDNLMNLNGFYYNLVRNQISIDNKENLGESTYANEKDIEEVVEEKIEKSPESNDAQINNKFSAILAVLALNKPERWFLFFGGIAALISGAAMPIYAIVFGDVLMVLSNDDNEYVRTEGNKYSLYFLIIGIVSGLSTFFQWYLIGVAGEKLTRRVRALMFECVLRQEVGWYDRKENAVGAICAKLSSDGANIQGASGHPVIIVLNSLSNLLIAAGISLYYDWRLALVALSFVPLVVIGTYLEQAIAQKGTYGNKSAIEQSTKIAVDAVSNIRTVAALGCEEIFQELYNKEIAPHYLKSRQSAHIRGVVLGLSRSLMFFAYGVAFYYGGVLIVDEYLDFSKVFKISEALISAAWTIGSIIAFAPNFQKAIIAANRMALLTNRKPEITDEKATYDFWKSSKIVYDKVDFAYPTRKNLQVLHSFDIDIKEGTTVALVGPSGCGKSTIIQQLQRFYDPISGHIRIDSIELNQIKIRALRSKIGIVSQEPNLFDRSIGENIAYGDNNRLVPMEEIIEAAKKANIHNFIASLPLGYSTNLGSKGTQLSGGQKQRIAIARALIRNPNILLLDEATSALDSESEKVVQEALDSAREGRTCIVIAHRLTTIQDADVICVMDKGKVIEKGTHEELLQLRGLYHKLYSIQQGST
ncbi:ATP-dependent translocase ABCB1-like isoform X2 [Onthophagus taurus]|uniref:ATP-dependent translocase ABCB1-like isoform X2 n=1 Tax=Onthophagus taurus TaxID=166361 RepID=UPI000C207123|nr:multidrug resistance protein 1-like isoform X2 [Onthophagus taurus]